MAAAGRGMDAYRRVAPREATFHQLAFNYVMRKQVDELAGLVAAHREHARGDTGLLRWEGQVLYMRGEYADAARMLTRYRQSIANEPRPKFGPAYDPLIRSLLRGGDAARALEESKSVHEQMNEPLYLAIVHAAAGRVAEATPLLDEFIERATR